MNETIDHNVYSVAKQLYRRKLSTDQNFVEGLYVYNVYTCMYLQRFCDVHVIFTDGCSEIMENVHLQNITARL